MPGTFRSKALRLFAETGAGTKLPVQNADRIRRILAALNASMKPEDMNIPGFKFHPLRGKDRGRYSVWVTGNYRITFGWSGEDAVDVDIEDYH